MNDQLTMEKPSMRETRRGSHGVKIESANDLQHDIEHAAHLLPAQGPITVFIHHNTLHAFEDLTFTEAVKQGAKTFSCHPYLGEDRFREELAKGRIQLRDLQAVLQEDLGKLADEKIVGLVSRRELQMAMLQFPVRVGPTEELLWFMAETDALRHVRGDVSSALRRRLIAETRHWAMRDLRGGNEAGRNGGGKSATYDDSAGINRVFRRFDESTIESWSDDVWEAFTLQMLWRVCREGIGKTPAPDAPPLPIRHRDLLLKATGVDSDTSVNELLVLYCAAFLDQGLAHWPLPSRELGFFGAFSRLYRQAGGPPDVWLRDLPKELARIEAAGLSSLECISESLDLLGVADTERSAFLSATLLALPGWAGMIRQLELRGDRVAHPVPAGSLVDFLAVRLLLDRLSLVHAAKATMEYTGSLRDLRGAARARIGTLTPPSLEQRAFVIFQLVQVLGLSPATLHGLSDPQWAELVVEIEAFSSLERRRVFFLAYERRFVNRTLDVVALRPRHKNREIGLPRYQVVTCIDDREESFRRHLEEVAPDVETFGAAGFFGVAMYFRGISDAHFVPLCPIVLVPQHWVAEQVDDSHAETHERRARARRALGNASHRFHAGSRGIALGAVLTVGVGVLATIPLVASVVFPRLTARIRSLFGRFVQAPPATKLKLERTDAVAGSENGHLGYTLEEMVNVGERQLRDIGLTANLARLVLFLGHGSLSLNNPHKSAYDCGACGGSPGAANGRALAQILNDERVRRRLADRGLEIPASTVFVGGWHNTCDDAVEFYDIDRVPESHRPELERIRGEMETVLDRNAHERCRRFMSAPLTLSFNSARAHVEGRSADLAQTRPELGHATNAICFVGRRERTRGLFFDRRAFLTSYDPTKDDEDATILTRLLSAAVPVCAGINLEYYFSRVDPAGWGCGTKLPHNVSALLGVMDGAASDLRTGLPWQMVEIHEPVRLLFIIETTPETMLRIMDRNPGIGNVLRFGWALLAVQDPHSAEIQVYRDGAFHLYDAEATTLPTAASSVDWYRGWRDHLEFAEIGD